MIRTRLLWFGLGFASTAGAIAQFIFKDLCLERHSLDSQLKENFNSLDARVFNLESVFSSKPTPAQESGMRFLTLAPYACALTVLRENGKSK